MSGDEALRSGEERRAYRVHGRVQGVGFRWWAQHQAQRLGLRGLVRNLPDGSVEVVLAGPRWAVDEMTQRLRVGPPAAHVRQLEPIPPPERIPPGFEIAF